VSALTVVGFDPVRDKRYRDTALGRVFTYPKEDV
jgi:hypothetical protein